jgi:hypothetical protein
MQECIPGFVGSLTLVLRTPGISPVASSGTGASSLVRCFRRDLPLQVRLFVHPLLQRLRRWVMSRTIACSAVAASSHIDTSALYGSRSGPHPTPGNRHRDATPFTVPPVGGLVRRAVQ